MLLNPKKRWPPFSGQPSVRLLLRIGLLSQFVVRTEHVDNLVLVHLLHLVAGGTAELTGIKLSGFVVQHLAHSSGERQT